MIFLAEPLQFITIEKKLNLEKKIRKKLKTYRIFEFSSKKKVNRSLESCEKSLKLFVRNFENTSYTTIMKKS